MREEIAAYQRNLGGLMSVELAGISYCDGSYRIQRQNSDVYVFEYVIGGRGTIIQNQREYTASAGDVYLLHTGGNHCYFSSADDPWIKIWFNVKGPLADALVGVYGLTRCVYGGCGAFALFSSFVSMVKNEFVSGMAASFAAQKFHEIVAFIATYDDGNTADDADVVRKYIDDHVRDSVSLRDMAGAIYRSPSQTIRIFREKFGKTPCRYLLEKRIEAAETLLRNTGLTVQQIAAELNFADEHYFSNVFTKCTGVRPGRYRILPPAPISPSGR